MVAGADPLRWGTVHGRRRAAEPCRPQRSGGPEWACFLERSGREEPVRRGPTREIARGGEAGGKNSAAMVSCGPATSIGPTPKQGFGPSDAPQRTSACRIHCKRGGGLVQGAVPVAEI